jgi:photosystem II stability/assembly factor-like uncharacterized protein
MPAVWASGSNGVILRSTDLGKTWKRLHVAGGDTLDFRGIVAFNATTAYLMSSGEGQKSRGKPILPRRVSATLKSA